ncbi:MAG: ABC transporter ATP-binding protein [Clostridiaceae bacterium]
MAKDNNFTLPIGIGRNGGFGQKVIKPKDRKSTFKRLWRYLTKQKGKLFFVFSFVLIGTLLNLAVPFLIGYAIDNYIIYGNFRGLFFLALILIFLHIIITLTTLLQNNLMIEVAQETVKEMRSNLLDKFHSLPLAYFDNNAHGELMSRVTNDIENVSAVLNTSILQIFTSSITLAGALLLMLWYSPLLTLLSLITIPFLIIGTKALTKISRKYFGEQQKTLGELNGFIEETISGLKVVKVFEREIENVQQFEIRNRKLRDIGLRAQIFSGWIPTLFNQLNNTSYALIAGGSGLMAIRHMISVGAIAGFLGYLKQFSKPVNEISNQINQFQSALAGAERVFEVIDESGEVTDSDIEKRLGDIKGEVNFRGVSFGYKRESPVLKDINLKIKPGQTIALVGTTGAGKTTIANLITRFYDTDSGVITIDGYDIREVSRDSLRSALGIVLQDNYLFKGTIRENIRYGRISATDEEVERAARLANIDYFVHHLQDGYDTMLTENGGNLSQGQRQLISIARVILAEPSILILDEATSSVDTRTEFHIQKAMLNLMKNRTSFVIAHRISTIKEADLIVVIDGGEVIEKGTHEQLLKHKGFYYNLYWSQFKSKVKLQQ